MLCKLGAEILVNSLQLTAVRPPHNIDSNPFRVALVMVLLWMTILPRVSPHVPQSSRSAWEVMMRSGHGTNTRYPVAL
jgi:hypothetical protein